MANREIRKMSPGFYSTNIHRTVFSNPKSIELLNPVNNIPLYSRVKTVGAQFMIPAPSNTVALETKWLNGGLVCPDRKDFGMSKHEWNITVVRALEPHLPSKTFSGKRTFSFHGGFLQHVV